MDWLSRIPGWIAENETFLSGLAAIVAVATVILTPLGLALRQRRREASTPVPPPPSPAAETPRAAPASDRPSLAVLPFTNLSEDRDQEFLADGMTEDLITGLAANRHLSVVSRNSTFAYKGRSPDIRDVGRELGVRYVLEGSVRRVGDRMRTTAQLIDAASGDHLWAEKYDRPYAEMFEVQDEVVASIAGALNAQLSSAEYERVRRELPSQLGVWERVQRAFMGSMRNPSRETVESGIAQLREAVELDPDYAYARSALAWMLQLAIVNGLCDDLRGFAAEARTHLSAALNDPADDPLTHFYAGAAQIYSGHFERGMRTLERSLARNPHQPDVYMHLGLAKAHLSRFEEAYAEFDRAEQLAPSGGFSSGYVWYRSQVLGFEQRYEEAVALLESFLTKAGSYASPRITLGLFLDALGRHEEARAAIDRALRENPGLNFEGIALQIGAVPDRELGAARVAKLREYWPAEARPA